MARCSTILLALLYFVLTCGVHLHVDTCCASISEVAIGQIGQGQCSYNDIEESACCMPVSEKTEACCTLTGCSDAGACPTDEIDLKLDTEVLTNQVQDLLVAAVSSIQVLDLIDYEHALNTTVFILNRDDSAPIPIYIKTMSLVFYG